VAGGFALSCFGLLVFLWVTFGGPIPFAAQGYRFTADFPEATNLAKEADVRISGVSVGKVKQIEQAPADAPNPNTTRATIELNSEFAPLAEDAKGILRQKTLLGETYVEITQGKKQSQPIPEGGHMKHTRVVEATQIDEIFNALDKETRTAFQDWLKYQGQAINKRGLDLNDAFGNLGPFASDASDVLATLDKQDEALSGLVRDTGTVFEALTAHDQELAGVITNSNRTFRALASRDQALAETFRIFPTFLDESKATLARLEDFSRNTRPLVQDLKPVADDATPTLKSLRRIAPDLKNLFRDLDALNRVSKRGLPATRRLLNGLAPLLKQLDPFLAELNPVVAWLNYMKPTIGDFLAGPPAALKGTLGQAALSDPRATGHVLRQTSYTSAESLALWPQRLPSNRGNGYPMPRYLAEEPTARNEIFPNFDCKPSGVKRPDPGPIPPASAACFVAPDYSSEWGGGRAPQLRRDR
jgi:phospholipid/cholesterol/gamma-HCH transport system substrate-binding protein